MQAFGFGDAECEVVVKHRGLIGRGGSRGMKYGQPFYTFGYEEEDREGSIGMRVYSKNQGFSTLKWEGFEYVLK